MAKLCTTIEQSKKLTELGLSRETSDMFYWCGTDLRIGGYKAQDKDTDIPAWSLSALLDAIPKSWEFAIYKINGKYSIGVEKFDNAIDAVLNFIYFALENKTLYDKRSNNYKNMVAKQREMEE